MSIAHWLPQDIAVDPQNLGPVMNNLSLCVASTKQAGQICNTIKYHISGYLAEVLYI